MENLTNISTQPQAGSASFNPSLLKIYSYLRQLSPEERIQVLDQELETKRANERHELYEPNGKVESFIKLVGSKSDLVNIMSSANGIGKTTFGVNLLAALIWPGRNRYFSEGIFRDWPSEWPRRIRYITNPKLVEEIGPFNTEIEKWWPKGQYERFKGRHQYFSQFAANGWIVDVMTYEQDASEFEGGNIGVILCDEPPPKKIWPACLSRLRAGGVLIVLMTPLTDAAWFFDEVVPNHQKSIVYADVEDACKMHGIRGHLEHEQIAKLLMEMDDTEIEARGHGRAMYLQGLIFKNFNYDVHVAKEPIDVPDGAQVWQIVDPAVDKPFASIWGYPDRTGTFNQIAEWPTEDFYKMHGCNYGIDDYAKIFRSIEMGWDVKKRIIDRHFAEVRSLQTNRTLREDLQGVGLYYEPSYSAQEEVETGILKVRSALKYNDKKPIDSVNRPKYIVDARCKNTIKGFQRWSFDPKTGKIQDDFKDFMDCVRYALMANPKVAEDMPPAVYKKLYG